MSVEERQELFELNKDRLEEIAQSAITNKGLKLGEFVIVCIEVDDPSWIDLVDHLMPGADWQQFRDKGEAPVVRGSVELSMRDYVSEVMPDLAKVLHTEPPNGSVQAIVMGSGGASV